MGFDWKEACINTERKLLRRDDAYVDLLKHVLDEHEVISQITSLIPKCERLSYGKGCNCESVCTIVKKYLELEGDSKNYDWIS